MNIRRCLEYITWRGDWKQIRGTDGNETEVGSQNREKRERTRVNKWENFNGFLQRVKHITHTLNQFGFLHVWLKFMHHILFIAKIGKACNKSSY